MQGPTQLTLRKSTKARTQQQQEYTREQAEIAKHKVKPKSAPKMQFSQEQLLMEGLETEVCVYHFLDIITLTGRGSKVATMEEDGRRRKQYTTCR